MRQGMFYPVPFAVCLIGLALAYSAAAQPTCPEISGSPDKQQPPDSNKAGGWLKPHAHVCLNKGLHPPARVFRFRVQQAIGTRTRFWMWDVFSPVKLHRIPRHLQNMAIAKRLEQILTGTPDNPNTVNPFSRFNQVFAVAVADARVVSNFLKNFDIDNPIFEEWVKPSSAGNVATKFSSGMAIWPPCIARTPAHCGHPQKLIEYTGAESEYGEPCPEGGSAYLLNETWSTQKGHDGTAARNIMIFYSSKSGMLAAEPPIVQHGFVNILVKTLESAVKVCFPDQAFYKPPVDLAHFAFCLSKEDDGMIEPFKGIAGIQTVRRSIAIMPAAVLFPMTSLDEVQQEEDPGICASLIEAGDIYFQCQLIRVVKGTSADGYQGDLLLNIFILPHIISEQL